MRKRKLFIKNNILKKSISKDHFIVDSQEEYAGCHIILDLWDAKFNNSINTLRKILKETIKISGATLIHMHFHRFGKEQGISGVAVLAESHISVHTWPRRLYSL